MGITDPKTICFILFFVCGLILCCSEVERTDNIEGIKLVIKSSKDNYIEGERIWVKAKLINSTGLEYNIENDFAFMSGISFNIKDQNGKIIYPKIVAEPGQDTGKLSPQDTLFAYGELGWYFNKYQSYTGEYTIAAIFQGIKSNSIKISFTKPQGNDLIVYENMKEIDKKVRENSQYFERSLIDLENLFYEYPSSTYAPYLFNKITMTTGIPVKEKTKYNNLLNKFLDSYSNSYESFYTLLNYEWYLKKVENMNDANTRAKLKELSKKYKGTLTDEIIINKFLKSSN